VQVFFIKDAIAYFFAKHQLTEFSSNQKLICLAYSFHQFVHLQTLANPWTNPMQT